MKILFFYFIRSLCFSFMHCLPYNSILKSTWKICKIWKDIWSDFALWGAWNLLSRSHFFTTKYASPLLLSSFHYRDNTTKANPTQPNKNKTIHSITKTKNKFFFCIIALYIEVILDLEFDAMAITGDSLSQFHVLAVDDSLIDRKLIERLLKTSSYQGTDFTFSG